MKFYLTMHDTLHGFYKENDFSQIAKKICHYIETYIYIYIYIYIYLNSFIKKNQDINKKSIKIKCN